MTRIKKPTSPVKASTQSFIEIEDIKDDILLMKDFSASVIIEVGAVNYWLLSTDEQEALISTYGNILNSLSFPVQILILSKRMDISSYLEFLDQKAQQEKDQKLAKLLTGYQNFIKTTVKKSAVLEKRFFFVVPFSPFELGVTAMAKRKLNSEYVITRAKTSLYPKRDNLIRLLSKVGLKATPLKEQEMLELFHNLYNPSSTGRGLAPVKNYTDIVMTAKVKN